ncbi:MAG: DMT family transporter [Deltaproteobacteria bacterium]|nr:DMT family transporter [Deltaproteobacteria bacterium]
MHKPQGLFGTICVALGAMGWGTWALFVRGRDLAPVWLSAMILVVIAACSLPLALTGKGRPHQSPRPARMWWLLALLGFFDAGNYILYFGAVQRGPLAVAVLTHYLAPVVVAVAAPLVLKERLGARTPVALAISLGGLVLLVLGAGGFTGHAGTTALLGGGSAFFYGANTLLSKKLFTDFSLLEVLGWHVLVSALLLVVVAQVQCLPMPPVALFLWKPLLGAVLLGVGCAVLFYLGLDRIPAQRAAVLTYLEPVVAALVGFVWFAEPLSPLGLAGMALIVASGVAVALQDG